MTVHTSGINWESIGAITAVMTAAVAFITWLIARRDNRAEIRSNEIKVQISDSVNHLGEILTARLETKETVARISERLARVEGSMVLARNAGDP